MTTVQQNIASSAAVLDRPDAEAKRALAATVAG